ncbi:OPT oligopeptide transporter protein-domain-containing protein [Blyttiomyces helicus]|uniref:OPT oligopeptide transporter protein-domain-containing protein n=1 Tax=Blyttiomyces helicus TaxID=388810 RepID=A0A4P9W8W7_9FUNG|nr:OPT oligopeptide transporter protein-domain-containing protein [Blyttiomyces helicus]|eukprot:RKO88981.1 OPT oligopeptide transporter protein-domain-containing protein [Blyttiomyces helicus]
MPPENKRGPVEHGIVKNTDVKDVLETGSLMEAASIDFGEVCLHLYFPPIPPVTPIGGITCPRTSDCINAISFPMQAEFPGEQSIVPEVAGTVPVSDDPTLSSLTFRFLVIGTVFSIFSVAVAQFMYFRENTVTLNNFSIILMTYPCGELSRFTLSTSFPRCRKLNLFVPFDFLFTRGTFIGGSLNPGPYNIKEHTLIMVAASVNNGPAYATDILAIQRLFYGPDQNPFKPDPNGVNVGRCAALLLIITTQCVGYGFAGVSRNWLVKPAAMWYPSNVVLVNILHVFHAKFKESLVGERSRLFNKLTAWVIVHEFPPLYFAKYLANVSIICLAFGSLKGRLGSTADYPLENPGDSANVGWRLHVSLLRLVADIELGPDIGAPWIYRENVWDANLFPLASAGNYDIFGGSYNISKALSYGTNFSAITALLVHVALFHGKLPPVTSLFTLLMALLRPSIVHVKIMSKYPEVPNSWYILTLVVFLGLSIFTVEYYKEFQIRWWGILFAMFTAVVFVVPIGIISAVTNVTLGTNGLTELIFGLVVPGKAIANVCFKTYGYSSMGQALNLVADLKLGVYMSPPKAMFISQMYATWVGGVVNYAVMDEVIRHVPDVWYANHDGGPPYDPAWGSTSPKIFYTASLIWGAIGPKRMFGTDSPFHPLLWFSLGSVFVPIPFYLLHRRHLLHQLGLWSRQRATVATGTKMLFRKFRRQHTKSVPNKTKKWGQDQGSYSSHPSYISFSSRFLPTVHSWPALRIAEASATVKPVIKGPVCRPAFQQSFSDVGVYCCVPTRMSCVDALARSSELILPGSGGQTNQFLSSSFERSLIPRPAHSRTICSDSPMLAALPVPVLSLHVPVANLSPC